MKDTAMNILSHNMPRIRGRSDRPVPRFGRRTMAIAAIAISLAGFGMLHGASKAARAVDDPPPGKVAAASSAFVAEIQRTLKDDDVRLIALAHAVLADPSAADRVEDELERLRIDVTRTEGESRYATLRREIAALMLKEYVEAILPRDLTAKEATLTAAKADLMLAGKRLAQADEGVEKIKARLGLKTAEFALQEAESLQKVLEGFTKSTRTKELEADLSRARSEEYKKKSEWELSRARLAKAQKAATADLIRTEAQKRILTLLDRAVPIEEQIQVQLQQRNKEPNPNDVAEKEIRDQIDQLAAIIEEAEAIKAANDFAQAKERLKRTARRSTQTTGELPPREFVPPATTASRPVFLRVMRRSLTALDRRLADLARQVSDQPGPGQRAGFELVNQRITTKSAEANYLNHKLTREVAEIAISEYRDGVYVQDVATLEGEVQLAENDLKRARDIVAFSPAGDDKVWAQLNERRSRLTLRAAEAGRKALVDYTKTRRIKELESEVAKAHVDEVAKQAIWEHERRIETRLEKAAAADRGPTIAQTRGLERLRRAANLEEQAQSKLGQLEKQGNSDDHLQKEIRDLTNQLEALVDEAEAAIAADDFADLKPRIRAVARLAGAGGPG